MESVPEEEIRSIEFRNVSFGYKGFQDDIEGCQFQSMLGRLVHW